MTELNIIEKYLTLNPYSRYGGKMEATLGLVFHYPAVAGQTAEQMWWYFENLKNQIPDEKGKVIRKASPHLIIDFDGTVYQLMSLDEIAFHGGPVADTKPEILKRYGPWPNAVLWGVEMCHIDEFGHYTEATLDAARELGARLCEQGGFSPDEDILRHNDITGKLCPRFFVEHPADWVDFKTSIKRRMLAVACTGAEGGD